MIEELDDVAAEDNGLLGLERLWMDVDMVIGDE